MANRKANEERCLMRVPVSFKKRVLKIAREVGIPATTYLETVVLTDGMEDETEAINNME